MHRLPRSRDEDRDAPRSVDADDQAGLPDVLRIHFLMLGRPQVEQEGQDEDGRRVVMRFGPVSALRPWMNIILIVVGVVAGEALTGCSPRVSPRH